jgi:hypothetical protein
VQNGGPTFDLLNSYPADGNGWKMPEWQSYNYGWGQDLSEEFLHRNGLSKIINAGYPSPMAGFNWFHAKQGCTILSPPNYGGRFGNDGAVLELDEFMRFTIHTFKEAPGKRDRPDWSMRTPDYML